MSTRFRPKITVVGAGNVGATLAHRIADSGLGDVILVDVVPNMPLGKALDLEEASPVVGTDCRLIGSNDYGPIEGSDLVVITAGLARKPGMSRDDLLMKNAEIVGGVAEHVKNRAPNAVVIVVSNPLDVMTQLTESVTGFGKKRVLGMAGVLDQARFALFIARELGVSVQDVRAMVLGGHGDDMVPLPRYSTVSGIPITDLMPKDKIDALIKRTREGGAEIVALLGTGSAFYAPAASILAMTRAVLRDERRILPCCTRLEGEYGLRGVYVGVPVVLGAGGVEKIIELKLLPEETKSLQTSADHVRESVKKLGI
ncbi:MAG: malate dehydrogenase [Planctomycetes bacterium]|nr:malate dehydrogenase [Planctomycetota bacterium]MBI3847735.1 malate dehydrogenase [Planctomycetota bacterium]